VLGSIDPTLFFFKMSKFILSNSLNTLAGYEVVLAKDVRKFIKLLKEKCKWEPKDQISPEWMIWTIDQLAGEGLNE
jgi:hypothetical protein